jgi:hypothetical protein
METIAIYWESKIRTYGFNLLEGLALGQVSVPNERLAQWGRAMHKMTDPGPSFRLVWAQNSRHDRIKFFVLCDDNQLHRMESFLNEESGLETESWQRHAKPVDLLFFQGPHFGDRYGIMDYMIKALADRQVPRLAAACSVATIYLVVPSGWGGAAKDVLSSAFKIPMRKIDIS